MFEYLNSNPLIVLVVGVVIVFVLMFIFVKKPGKKKTSSTKEKKSEGKDSSDKKEETKKEPEEKAVPDKTETEKTEDKNEKVEKTEKKRVKKSKQKPEITQVYKKTTSSAEVKKQEKTEDKEEIVDDLEKRAQFVKTSGKISKFIGLSDVVAPEELAAMESEFSEMVKEPEPEENCEICEKFVKHFDHSRRLSKMIQEDSFDDMLNAHISDKYLKMDSKRHLCIGENFEEKLFDRALKTISNSEVKVLAEGEGEERPVERIRNDKDYMRQWLEQKRKYELSRFIENESEKVSVAEEEFVEDVKDDIDLSSKNIIVVDAITKRKGRPNK